MTLTSRHFGAVETRVVGEPAASTAIDSEDNGSVEVDLIAVDPAHLRQEHLDQADAALDVFDQLDRRVREAVLVAASDEGSVPGQTLRTRNDVDPGRDITPEEFTRSLRIAHARISPDGGPQSPDRVSITYVSAARIIEQRFDAVVREGVGVVFVESRRPASSSTFR